MFAVGFWVVSWFVPGVLIEWAWGRRVRQIDAQIPQSVSALANSMRAGLTLVQAIARLSEQAPEPIRTEFKIMANQYAYGADMETVIRNAKARLDLPNFCAVCVGPFAEPGDGRATFRRRSRALQEFGKAARDAKDGGGAHVGGADEHQGAVVRAGVHAGADGDGDAPGVALLFTTAPGMAILCVAAVLSGTGVYLRIGSRGQRFNI